MLHQEILSGVHNECSQTAMHIHGCRWKAEGIAHFMEAWHTSRRPVDIMNISSGVTEDTKQKGPRDTHSLLWTRVKYSLAICFCLLSDGVHQSAAKLPMEE
jgi:hypothetical protein